MADVGRPKCGRDYFSGTDEAGIFFDDFVRALQIWSFMRPGAHQVTVREASDSFGVTDQVIRDAVEESPWMFLGGPDDDPTKQYIDHDGE